MALAEKLERTVAPTHRKTNQSRRLPTDFDKRIGNLLKAKRRAADLSIMECGRRVGLVFQQIQKYEKGENRITVDRFMDMAAAIGFDPAQCLKELADMRSQPQEQDLKVMDKYDAHLISVVQRIASKRDKKALLALARHFAEGGDEE